MRELHNGLMRIAIIEDIEFKILAESDVKFCITSPMLKTKGGGPARIWIDKSEVDRVEER